MYKKLLLIGYFTVASILQLTTGNFPLLLFAFPLNAILAVGWSFLLVRLYRENRSNVFTRFLVSPQTSILSILLFIGGSLVIGLFPQLSVKEAASLPGIWAALGCYDFMTSWIFIAILFLLLSNLTMVCTNALYHRPKHRFRFLLNHIGLGLALFAGFFGSSDVQTLQIPLYTHQPERKAYDANGAPYYLDYELELKKFEITHYANGMPMRFTADVRIGNKQTLLEVNHPHNYRFGEDVYLTGYDTQAISTPQYCILQIVRQPWKYVTVAGILMMLTGAILLFINGPKPEKQ